MSYHKSIAASVASLAAFAIGSSVAAAKPTTLHIFSKEIYSRVSDTKGKFVPPPGPINAGYHLSFASDDYLGNHKHHAKKPFASDKVNCTVLNAHDALCNGEIALGGPMVFADDFLSTQANRLVAKISGGTGRYRHAHGTVTAVAIPHSDNEDLTVRIK